MQACKHMQACMLPYMQVERAKAAAVPLRVTLPDGTQREGIAGVTTPAEIVATLARSLAKKAVAAKVDGRTWDLSAPLPGDCALQILTFDDPEGKEARISATLLHALPPAACKEHPKQHILWSPNAVVGQVPWGCIRLCVDAAWGG